jgi:hypothetical protein
MDDRPTPQNPQDPTENAARLTALGMSPEAARTYASFIAGGRWPRPSDVA